MVWQFFAAPREAKAATEAMERTLSLTMVVGRFKEFWIGKVIEMMIVR